ncbi:hypothetical protein [Vibrio sp. D431a]|uniref:hypothetical protein n=1 Tax=Vibrio sp. D431a TaxID=2837388 RepID=UPI0025534E83|nr:hypothetical protein [Vibrio sp. D431a]MDK9790011.1 hypothetical protein [Vibrio sp. D431a]
MTEIFSGSINPQELVTLLIKFIEVLFTPILAGIGAFIAAKIFSRREAESLRRALGYAVNEIEYQKALVEEHVENNRALNGQSYDRTARQNVMKFRNKFSTKRFTPSQIEMLRKRFKLEDALSKPADNSKYTKLA